jgi:hypothetical protein
MEPMSRASNRAHAAAVDGWRRLWSVGANGENISTTTINTNTDTHQFNTSSRRKVHPPQVKQAEHKKTRRTKHHRDPQSNTLMASQRDLHGNNQGLLDAEEYGDKMSRKQDNTLRLMLHNINRLPIDSRSDKSRRLINTIVTKQIDISLLTEIGLCWRRIENKDQWFERVRESFQSTHDPSSPTTPPN